MKKRDVIDQRHDPIPVVNGARDCTTWARSYTVKGMVCALPSRPAKAEMHWATSEGEAVIDKQAPVSAWCLDHTCCKWGGGWVDEGENQGFEEAITRGQV